VIFDCGSFDGGDAWRLFRAYPDAQVFAFEPDPQRAIIVRENLALTNIEVQEWAICHLNGWRKWHPALSPKVTSGSHGSLYPWKDSTVSKFVEAGLAQGETNFRVECVTLYEACTRLQVKPDVLYMDIEGAEMAALRGLGSFRPEIIYLEVLDYWNGREQINETFIKRLGYKKVLDVLHNQLWKKL